MSTTIKPQQVLRALRRERGIRAAARSLGCSHGYLRKRFMPTIKAWRLAEIPGVVRARLTAVPSEADLFRFASKLRVTANGCWRWRAAKKARYYGKFNIAGVSITAHHVAYTWAGLAVPVGLELDHLCRVRNCANPDHLEPVTRQENLFRGKTTLAAKNAAKKRCKRGHSLTDPRNVRLERSPNGNERRVCRACCALLERGRQKQKALQC